MKFDFFVFFLRCIYKRMKFLLNLNFEFEWKCMFEYIKFDFFYTVWRIHLWMHESLIEYGFLIWMKMNVWVHEIWFFLFFLKNAFMNVWNFCEFYERKCMLECMSSFCLFDIILFFFKNAFMNAWNFVNSLNENACLNT